MKNEHKLTLPCDNGLEKSLQPATRIYNYVLGGFGEIKQKKKKKKDWPQLLAQVPIFKKKKVTSSDSKISITS